VSDTNPAEPPADQPAPDDIVDAEVVETAPVEPGFEPVVPPAPADTGYTASGVPTFDAVREKIETRFGTSMGAAELAAETPEGRSVEEQYEARQKAAAERLAQIRASMKPADES
jgi:hypothetical protein